MDSIEGKIKPKPVEELTLEQLMQLVQQLESEVCLFTIGAKSLFMTVLVVVVVRYENG